MQSPGWKCSVTRALGGNISAFLYVLSFTEVLQFNPRRSQIESPEMITEGLYALYLFVIENLLFWPEFQIFEKKTNCGGDCDHS